jgi:hypothetical protein
MGSPDGISLIMVNKSAEELHVFQDVETKIFMMHSGDDLD